LEGLRSQQRHLLILIYSRDPLIKFEFIFINENQLLLSRASARILKN
jgi:hypothetical protein